MVHDIDQAIPRFTFITNPTRNASPPRNQCKFDCIGQHIRCAILRKPQLPGHLPSLAQLQGTVNKIGFNDLRYFMHRMPHRRYRWRAQHIDQIIGLLLLLALQQWLRHDRVAYPIGRNNHYAVGITIKFLHLHTWDRARWNTSTEEPKYAFSHGI